MLGIRPADREAIDASPGRGLIASVGQEPARWPTRRDVWHAQRPDARRDRGFRPTHHGPAIAKAWRTDPECDGRAAVETRRPPEGRSWFNLVGASRAKPTRVEVGRCQMLWRDRHLVRNAILQIAWGDARPTGSTPEIHGWRAILPGKCSSLRTTHVSPARAFACAPHASRPLQILVNPVSSFSRCHCSNTIGQTPMRSMMSSSRLRTSPST